MRLLTNNPDKRAGLEGYGLAIEDRIPLQIDPTPENIGYLRTKQEKMGHLLDVPDAEPRRGGAGVTTFVGEHDGSGRRVAVVAARFNEIVTAKLVEGAVAGLAAHGVASDVRRRRVGARSVRDPGGRLAVREIGRVRRRDLPRVR